MARLRNRIRKSDYFSDGELLRWPRDKRATYSGLYAIAEDSGCLADDPFEWKCLLWPSPLDADITVEIIEQWRDEWIAAKKLIPYEVEGSRYFFLRSFHKHEHPRNPQAPNVPLPSWLHWVANETKEHRGHYEVDEAKISSNGSAPKVAALPIKAKPPADTGFDEFWAVYPMRDAKRACLLKWGHLTKKERAAAIDVATQMKTAVDAGVKQKEYVPRSLTFLNQKRWEDWADGPPDTWALTPAAKEQPLACWKCGEIMTGDDVLDGVYDEGKGWRHAECGR